LQAPADPAHVTPASARQIVLRQALILHQFAYQQGLFDGDCLEIGGARAGTVFSCLISD
jgi:hypothetical protein